MITFIKPRAISSVKALESGRIKLQLGVDTGGCKENVPSLRFLIENMLARNNTRRERRTEMISIGSLDEPR